MLKLKDDLATFFNADEFGDSAVIELPGGVSQPVVGNASTYADSERAGKNSNSSINAFMTGVADINVRRAQFMTAWHLVSGAAPECRLTISTGDHAGVWRVREIQRDGDIARLILNATT